MRNLLLVSFFIPSLCFSNSGTDILLKGSSSSRLSSPVVKVQKQIVLDNPFLVQLYGSYKSLNITDKRIVEYFDLIFAKDFDQALEKSMNISTNIKKYDALVNASKLFLYWTTGLDQTFANHWLEFSVKNNFLKTELGIAFDQYISNSPSKWIIENGINFVDSQRKLITKLDKVESNFNYSVQAFVNIGKGLESLSKLSYLNPSDKLIVPLSQSAIIHFAKNGELAKAAKVMKDIYEPVIEKSSDIEEISYYYLTLARLLYQAKAYDASRKYYSLIPDESKFFLNARVESLWLAMRSDDLPTLKGEVKSLEFSEFKNSFLPELFLVSSMANLQTCQFDAVKDAFEKYLDTNRVMAQKISSQLSSSNPELIKDNFISNQIVSSIEHLEKEIARVKTISNNFPNITFLKKQLNEFKSIRNNIAKNQWSNRKKLLEQSIRNMRFVKIEYLSTMRRLKGKLALLKNNDSVSTQLAARSKSDQIKFPYDGVVFGDELFNYSSDIKYLCLKGKR